MIADRVRIEAYGQALRKAIRPGAVVMGIGTGPGIMAVLACQLGASRVYAIEPSEVVQIAREIAAANQCADKIEFFEDLSTKITVPVRADVIVSDMRGILPLFGSHIPSIADARRRFLAPGGTLIARKDRIWAAVVETSKHYGRIADPWDRNSLGQSLCVELEAKLLESDYFWRWTTQIESTENAGEKVQRFEQSQLQGAILSPGKLRKAASSFVPQLSDDGVVRRRTLELMDGRASLEVVARRLAAEFPQRFGHWHKALSFAGAISQELSR